MRTVGSSSLPVGALPGTPPPPQQAPPKDQVPPGSGPPDQIPLNFPLGCGPGPDPPKFPLGCGPGPDPPQFPPWLWAWTRSPSTSPLGVGLETPWRPAARHVGIPPAMHVGIATPVDRHIPVNILPCPKLRLRAVIKAVRITQQVEI